MTIGENIKCIRKSKGMTQVELGKKLNLGESTVRMWELGKSFPTVPTLIAFSNLAEMDMNEIFNGLGYEVEK